MYFALKFQNATASETLMNSTNIPQNLPSDIPSSIFCSIYWVIEESMAIPCVSMLFDHDMLVVYQEILLYMISFLKSSQTIFLTNFQLVSQFHSPQNTCTSNFLQFPRCFPQASTRILEVLQKLQIKPQITEMKELETFLDLNPPKIGYFARKKSHSYLTNLNLESQTDVSSRNLLDSRQSYRCIKCNRLTNSLIERACPICGGNWKFQFFNLK